MNFNISNPMEEPSVQRPTMFNNIMYKPIEWSQVPPQHMPWARSPMPQSQVMAFGTQASFPTTQTINTKPQSSGHCFTQPTHLIHCKRKSDVCSHNRVKQHITEERMAAHMSRLHISSESQAYEDDRLEETPLENSKLPAQRERRLIVCEEMRRLQTESIIPAALQRRLERPCMAVMLWQPPERITESLFGYRNYPTNICENNNNTTSRDTNNDELADEIENPNDVNNMDMDI